MMNGFREREIRRLVAALLFAPILIYSFFSVHTMPRFTDHGMEIIICTADGVGPVAAGDQDEPGRDPSHSPCDWSMQIHAAALADSGPVVEPLVLSRYQIASFEKTILRSGKINSGRYARAPPSLL